jgi:hypothetical protein
MSASLTVAEPENQSVIVSLWSSGSILDKILL